MAKLTTAQYAATYIKRYGFALVPLEPGKKMTTREGWGENAITDPDQAAAFYSDDNHAAWGVGAHLGKSGICSLDIDDADAFAAILEEYDLPADDIFTAPTIRGRGKRIMFSVPDGVSLPYCKLTWPKKDDPKKRFTVFELRAACDGKHRLDVLPPTIHPDTQHPYTWEVQPPKSGKLPPPPEWLIAIWTAWGCFEPQFKDVCPWAEKEIQKRATAPATPARDDGDQPSVIEAYCAARPLTDMLRLYGYTKRGKRWLSPHSGTGLAGVHLLDERRCWIHHASDPLCSDATGSPVNAFDLFCYYEHGGDASKAVKAAADELGMKPPKRQPPPIPDRPAPVAAGQAVSATEAPTPAAQQPMADETPPDNNGGEFRCLGYNGAHIFVLPRRSEQVVKLSAGALSKAALLQIASLEWWEMEYSGDKSVNWDMAINTLLRRCEKVGIYDARRERGRGAWYDNGRPVLHLGDHLIVGGEPKRIHDLASRYIYTRQAPMENAFKADPATDDQAWRVLELFQRCRWAKPEHALLAAGWAALAPVCGALAWRPHIWLTAQRGAGKSWVQSAIIRPLIGEGMILHCQGGTTEAGIRQQLRHDARPVVFDEAESEGAAARARMQSVLELARQASSETGAEIAKGTSAGSGMSFNIRSMFLLGSINVALKQASDESRFSVLELVPAPKTADSAAHFAALERDVCNLLTPQFCASIRARTYSAIPAIRENAKLLSRMVAEREGSQRAGDQIGALLAGVVSLTRTTTLTEAEALAFLDGLTLSSAREPDEVSDEDSCIAAIMQAQIRVEAERATTRPIGELVWFVSGIDSAPGVSITDAADALARHGVRVTSSGTILIANRHRELERILKDTAWGGGHKRVLARIQGARSSTETARFGGSVSRFVEIPIAAVR